MADGEVGSVAPIGRLNSDDVGVLSGREARLDLLLAEELSGDHDLVLWLLAEAGVRQEHPALFGGELDGM